MKYALDADHNLVPGDVLTFAYQGSGVATFIDGAGTGFRVPIGTRNLAGVSADGKVYLEDEGEPAALDVVSVTDADGVAEIRFADHTNRQLESICHKRGIEFKYHPNKAALIALLEDAD